MHITDGDEWGVRTGKQDVSNRGPYETSKENISHSALQTARIPTSRLPAPRFHPGELFYKSVDPVFDDRDHSALGTGRE